MAKRIGQKGVHYSPLTEFQKGATPVNKMPVGTVTIRIDKQGKPRAWRKIAEPNQWIPRAVYVWEQGNGQIPKGYIVHHRDGHTLNDSPGNLELLKRGEHTRIHMQDLHRSKHLFPLKSVVCSECHESYQAKRVNIIRPNYCPKCFMIKNNAWKKNYRVTKRSQRRESMQEVVP